MRRTLGNVSYHHTQPTKPKANPPMPSKIFSKQSLITKIIRAGKGNPTAVR